VIVITSFFEVMMKKWIILSCLFSLQSGAASISTYRIYLDSEHRQQKFMVKNRDSIQEKCEVSFDYMDYIEGGVSKKLSKEERVALSEPATKRLRYSPRKFTIEPKAVQYIAFSYQRQINDAPAEYRTYANIKCLKEAPEGVEGINLSPTIVHSVPLVIRTGKPSDLVAELAFTQIKQQANNIAFRLELQGSRSVYGDFNLVDAKGDKLSLLQKNVVLYPEMKYKDFAFSFAGFTNQNMKVEFQETGVESDKKRFSLPLDGE
jgi:hypothetical protein